MSEMVERIREGDKLWFVPRDRRHGDSREVTVGKVGRKWAQLDNHHRIDIVSLHADGNGYCSPGRCYRSRGDHDRETERVKAWKDLHLYISGRWAPPAHITTKQIEQIVAILAPPAGAAVEEGAAA